jgi:peptidoglycan hydrolase CwlO-like protein
MEQMSEMTIRPFDYKFNPEETNLEDVIEDLDIPEKHRSKQYVPVSIIKTIYHSMTSINDKLSKIQEEVDLNQISEKILKCNEELNEKSIQIDDIYQKLVKRNRVYNDRMVLRK